MFFQSKRCSQTSQPLIKSRGLLELIESHEIPAVSGQVFAFSLSQEQAQDHVGVLRSVEGGWNSMLDSIVPQKLIPEQQPILGHLHLFSLLYTITKNSAVEFFGRVGDVAKKLDDLEQEDPEAVNSLDILEVISPYRPNQYNIFQNLYVKVRAGVLFDLAVSTVQRVYEILALKLIDGPKTCRSLVKSSMQSALRKVERYPSNKFLVAKKVCRTAWKGHVMYWSASFTVHQALDTYFTFFKFTSEKGRKGYPRRLMINFLQSVTACALSAIGASVGTLVRPGVCTMIGAMMLPQLASTLIN